MIVSAAAHYHHSHLTTAARSQVTCGRRRSLSLPVSPSLPLPLFWPCITSLCTPFLLPPPSPSDPSLPSVYLSFLHHPQLLSSGHCLEPQRIICAIHSFHLSLFLCACPPPGYSGLPGRLRIPNPPDHSPSIHSDPGVQVCFEYSIYRFSNHTVPVSWPSPNSSTLHAASRLTIICCARVPIV